MYGERMDLFSLKARSPSPVSQVSRSYARFLWLPLIVFGVLCCFLAAGGLWSQGVWGRASGEKVGEQAAFALPAATSTPFLPERVFSPSFSLEFVPQAGREAAKPAALPPAQSAPPTAQPDPSPTPSASPPPSPTLAETTPTPFAPVTVTPGLIWLSILPDTPTPAFSSPPAAASGDERWIDVDLSEQRLYAYEGETLVNSFLVSTGTWRYPTVIGTFRIYVKLRYADMSGPDYYLPNVPYVMYFYKGYGLHGTYWHNNFGTPMSHGCVNLSVSDAAWLYNWASVGTTVRVHE